MGQKLIQLLSLMLLMSCLCKGQNTRMTCVGRNRIQSHNVVIQTKIDDLLSAMPKPKRVTRNRTEFFFVMDSSNFYVTYSQEINLFWFNNIGYRDVQGLASLYLISFKNNALSILIEDQVISKSFTFNDFQNAFEYSEQNVYYENKNKHLVCQDSPKRYYTYVCLPICNSMRNEYIVFCFNKKGFIDHLRLYAMSPLYTQQN